MITESESIARWTWGRYTPADQVLELSALSGARSVLDVLVGLRLSDESVEARVIVNQVGRSNVVLWDGTIVLSAGMSQSDMGRVVEDLRSKAIEGEVGSVTAFVYCTPTIVIGPEGRSERQEKAIRFVASARQLDEPHLSISFETFTDAWLPFDLKGRPQKFVYAYNAPRLTAALDRISDLMDDEADPDTPTLFANASETGILNDFKLNGDPADTWFFEVRRRNSIFQKNDAESGFNRSTDGPVVYMPVIGEPGLLGYLWASDAGSAMSFEPYWPEDAGYAAGLVWLDRIGRAYAGGMTPLRALEAMATYPDDPVSGKAISGESREVSDLSELYSMAIPNSYLDS
ncbi:hypothetical protein IU433_30440 [Nocardia puris]|uniref:hypothetical protein n=1 Tax=Nocardia puris TaxID=208602 RepID=UPI001894C929|nr:hypothetical protein [Nocardia puris]MBF6215436.1 hypothetical protein [Nocardia puris]MBF6369124.1 hypothetical protein [Nocardia puris]MBF6463325.1 hypothetical protein [Nocardia puris]